MNEDGTCYIIRHQHDRCYKEISTIKARKINNFMRTQGDVVEHYDKTTEEFVTHILSNAPISDPADDPNSSIDPATEPGWWPMHHVNKDKLKAVARRRVRKQHDPDLCPEDVQSFPYYCRQRKRRVKDEQFYFPAGDGEDFDIFVLRYDLRKMIGQVWYCDGKN